MKQIKFYAHDDPMGDITDEQCEQFRTWAKKQIQAEYPEHDIEVINEQRLGNTVWTNDAEQEQEITDFCSELWSEWDWDC